MGRHFHGFTGGVVEERTGAGEGEIEAFEDLDNFDAGSVLVPGAVAEVDDDVEVLTGEFGYLVDGGGFSDLEMCAVGFREVDGWIAGWIELAERSRGPLIRRMQYCDFHESLTYLKAKVDKLSQRADCSSPYSRIDIGVMDWEKHQRWPAMSSALYWRSP